MNEVKVDDAHFPIFRCCGQLLKRDPDMEMRKKKENGGFAMSVDEGSSSHINLQMKQILFGLKTALSSSSAVHLKIEAL